jgi:putative ABC transport system permease protein
LAVVGVALGCVLALSMMRVMSALLYSVTSFDPMTLIGVGLAMIATAIVASALPARRAAAVDPVITLRSE